MNLTLSRFKGTDDRKKIYMSYVVDGSRKYKNGRTETLRSCTPELVQFCNIMLSSTAISCHEKRQALELAISTHDQLMLEAKNGYGCDRHLFGLMTIALENGLALPELFYDNSFTKRIVPDLNNWF